MVKLFTPEYKKQCVEMVLAGKHSITQICKMMRVGQFDEENAAQSQVSKSENFAKTSGRFCGK